MNSIFSKKTKDENTTYDSMSSLSHTKWNCRYHIVFAPKYRRKIFYGKNQPYNFPEVVKFEIKIWPTKFFYYTM